ncbi:CHAP domain-containing protein [Asaia prunellae]|uniref:CHAP domain-containing protein n=1 Tax=Asaia prunellae TaxID=610245 RepID=UPI001FB05044|nr:CHAP domain-containing protein [Asaia prunellae]
MVGTVVLAPKAEARHKTFTHNAHAHRVVSARQGAIRQTRFTPRHHRSGGHVIQCVAYAKAASDVVLSGNARDWWENSRGVYARGSAPEPGSVLNFRAIRRMPYGHVAVVRAIEDNRTIVIDQSHWAQNGVAKNVRVIDVSPNNDWSAVRVALNSKTETYGSIYPTYGFIYGRPDDGVMMLIIRLPRHIVPFIHVLLRRKASTRCSTRCIQQKSQKPRMMLSASKDRIVICARKRFFDYIAPRRLGNGSPFLLFRIFTFRENSFPSLQPMVVRLDDKGGRN